MSDAENVTADDGARSRDRQLVQRVLQLLDLEPAGDNVFRAPGLQTEPRPIFGGHIVGQAVAAATRTVGADRYIHSAHAYYVRWGVTNRPIDFQVHTDADGASVSFRRVEAYQDDRLLLTLGAAFQSPGEGLRHQVEAPAVPPPEALADDYAHAADAAIPDLAKAVVSRASPLRFRSVAPHERFIPATLPARQAYWFRLADAVPGADQALHRTIFAYASDMMLLGTALMPHGRRWFDGATRIASLDHALWIHGDVRIDDWLLYQQESPWAGEGRGLNRGHVFDRTGRLVATVSQEGSLRPKA